MQNNNRKMFETLVSRTKIYLAIIFVLVIIVGIENSKLIIPAIVLFLIVMGYTYYANKKRKSEISETLQDLTLTVDTAAKTSLINSPFPLIILETDGNVIWRSTKFATEFVNVDINTYLTDFINGLKEKIESVKEEFDYILIDCPPSLGLITLNAFTASDSVLIPVQCEYLALEGLGQLMNTINIVKKHLNTELEIEGALLTMYDIRTNLSNQVVKEVNKYFENKVYKTVIPRNVKLSEAPSYGMPISIYDPRSKGAKSYDKLVKEFLKNNENNSKGKHAV